MIFNIEHIIITANSIIHITVAASSEKLKNVLFTIVKLNIDNKSHVIKRTGLLIFRYESFLSKSINLS